MTIRLPSAVASCAFCVAMGAIAQTAPAPAMTPEEKATLDAAFRQADADKDGKLSNAELVQIPVLATKFADLDKNRDGFVTSDEFAAGVTVKPN